MNQAVCSHLRFLVELQQSSQSGKCLLFMSLFVSHVILSIRWGGYSVEKSEREQQYSGKHLFTVYLFVSSEGDRCTLRRATLLRWPQEGAVKSKQTERAACSPRDWAHHQMIWGVRRSLMQRKIWRMLWKLRPWETGCRWLTWKWEPVVSWSALPLHCPYPGSWRSSVPGTQKCTSALFYRMWKKSYTDLITKLCPTFTLFQLCVWPIPIAEGNTWLFSS